MITSNYPINMNPNAPNMQGIDGILYFTSLSKNFKSNKIMTNKNFKNMKN